MDLTRWLLRVGAARPHVFLVPAVGGTAARLAVEAELARRGWPKAQSPADTDLLVVAGQPGPRLAGVVDGLWRQIPAPRARVQVDAAAAASGLDTAVAALVDRQPRSAAHQAEQHAAIDRRDQPDGPRQDLLDGDVEHGGPDGRDSHGDGHHGAGGHGSHGGHGAMEMPGGLPMADLGEDRDGLTLDRVHVPLGPVLPDWPAGLVIRVILQGDVTQDATAEILDGPGAMPSFWAGSGRAAARELDALGRFLALAGWDAAAARARRLRDEVLADSSGAQVADRVRALVRRVRGSWLLRRMIRGIPAGDADVLALLERRLAAVEDAMATPGPPHHDAASPGSDAATTGRDLPADLDALARSLVGAEFAALRLIVAAFDPDTAAAGPGRADPHPEAAAEVHHG